MHLRRLELNTIFNYTKDIRRYLYDIEESLKVSFGTNVTIQPTSTIADEIEPELPRFSCLIDRVETIIKIEISQVRLVVLIEYKKRNVSPSLNNIKLFEEETIIIKEIIKKTLIEFNILYEGIIVISENIVSDISDVKILEVNEFCDDKSEKESKIYNTDYFISTQKSFFRAYEPRHTIAPLNKNIDENFIGFIETYLREINNRVKYNNSDVNNNVINFNSIKNKLLEDIINGN